MPRTSTAPTITQICNYPSGSKSYMQRLKQRFVVLHSAMDFRAARDLPRYVWAPLGFEGCKQ
eukprot:1563701-Amphidinium_carterae.1